MPAVKVPYCLAAPGLLYCCCLLVSGEQGLLDFGMLALHITLRSEPSISFPTCGSRNC
jgi:hypothetical protein